jgi:hypothetical protein
MLTNSDDQPQDSSAGSTASPDLNKSYPLIAFAIVDTDMFGQRYQFDVELQCQKGGY